jgi:hypothetical protein
MVAGNYLSYRRWTDGIDLFGSFRGWPNVNHVGRIKMDGESW